jgi:hypothetical protein
MLRTVLVIAAVLFVLGGAATLAISPESGNGKADRGEDLTMEQLGARLASTMQSDLRDAQRKRNLDGRITVVRVDCKNEDYPRFTCLAQVAATHEARALRPRNTTITGRHGGGGGWVVKTTWLTPG